MQDAQEQISQKATQGDKGDRHSYPDAAEDQKLQILAKKENVPPTILHYQKVHVNFKYLSR